MKKKLMLGLASGALVVCLSLVFAVGIMGKDWTGWQSKNTGGTTATVNTSLYQSSVGENALLETDKDYVDIVAENVISKDAIVATDDLGRTLSTNGKGDNGRQVALFYVLWHDGEYEPELFDEVLAEGKSSLRLGQSYFWGEPLFGYYHTSDDYVIRKHVEMFIYADIDYLVFDTTNSEAYTTAALKVMKILHEYNEMGWDAPKVAFYTNTGSVNRISKIYADIYEQNKYPDTWYMVDGRPLIIGTALPVTCRDFFTFRASQWPNAADVDGGYPWISFDDDAKVYYDFMGEHGVIPVSVAQNCSQNACFSDNAIYGMTATEGGCRGRSYHDGEDNITEDSVLYGYNFQEEWDNAIASDAETAMILEWNEWIAGAWSDGGQWRIFDCINMEYSRDIEPMSGGYGDNYFMQMVENIRKFKNTGSKVTQTEKATIDIDGDFSQWSAISSTYADMAEGGIRRDTLGYSDRYVNNTGRNELLCSKVTQDSNNVYFYVQTEKDITDDYTGSWMNLYLDTDGVLDDSWNGYEYIVNYSVSSEGVSTIAKYNGTNFEGVGKAKFRVYGNQMMVSVSKEALGISGTNISLNFKWADSREAYSDVMDFYTLGDAMPYGRFNYAYNAK